MASDNHAHYGRIGLTVFAGVIAIAIALVYIAGIGDKSNQLLVETFYDYPVGGLSVGSAVNFRGVKIGEVREIKFANNVYWGNTTTADYQRVCIVMALDNRKTGDEDTEEAQETLREFLELGIRATIASNAVTGMSRIELNIPANPLPVPTLTWTPRYPLIPPQPSLMENMSMSLNRALDQFNRMDIKSVWSNVSSIAASASKLTKDVSEFVTVERAHVNGVLDDVGNAAAKIEDLAGALKANPSLLLRPNDPKPLAETMD